jgi:hypothetical protein
MARFRVVIVPFVDLSLALDAHVVKLMLIAGLLSFDEKNTLPHCTRKKESYLHFDDVCYEKT